MNSTYCNYPNHYQNGNYHNNHQNGGYPNHPNGGYPNHPNGGYPNHPNGGYPNHQNGGYPNHPQTSMGCTRCDRNNCSSNVCKKFTYILPQAIYFQEKTGFDWTGCLNIKVSKFNNTVSYLPVSKLLREDKYVTVGSNKKSLTFFQAAPPSNLPDQENENKLVNTSYDCDEVQPLTIILDVSGLEVVFNELIFDTSSTVENFNKKPIILLLPPDQTCVKRILTLSDDGATTDAGCIFFKTVELNVTYVYTITCNNISLNITSIIFNVKFTYPPNTVNDDTDIDINIDGNDDIDIDIDIDDGEDITANINIDIETPF